MTQTGEKLVILLLFLSEIALSSSAVQYLGSSLRVRRTSPIRYNGGSLQYTVTVEDEYGYQMQGSDDCQSTRFVYQCFTSSGATCVPSMGSTSPNECVNTPNPHNLGFGFAATTYTVQNSLGDIERTLSDRALSSSFDTTSRTKFYLPDPEVLTESVLNQPPQANMLPLVRARFGCATTLEIPIFDNDPFDSVRCELGNTIEECGGVCPLALYGGITLQGYPCQLMIPTINAPSSGVLRVPISLVIIDTNVHGIDMSRVSLQFTLDFVTASGGCDVPGYSPGSAISSNGFPFSFTAESTFDNSIKFEFNGQAVLTPRGNQSRQSNPMEDSFRLVLEYDEVTNPLPETVCFQYIDQNSRPSQVFCTYFRQGRARFSRRAVAGNAWDSIGVVLRVTQGVASQLDLTYDMLTLNGGIRVISPSVLSGSMGEESITISLGGGGGSGIEVGMVSIPQIAGPELLVYTHPLGSTDFFITIQSIALVGNNENLRIKSCRNGDLDTAAIMYIGETNGALDTSSLESSRSDSYFRGDSYFRIPPAAACSTLTLPLQASGALSLEFDVEGPYRISSEQSIIVVPLPGRCAVNPCQNNGICTEYGELCDCTETGFTGERCDSTDFVGQLDIVFEENVVTEGDIFVFRICLTPAAGLPDSIEAAVRPDFIGFSASNVDVIGFPNVIFSPTTESLCSQEHHLIPVNDHEEEGAEDFSVKIESAMPSSLTIGPAAELIIVDENRMLVHFQPNQYSVREGESVQLEVCTSHVTDTLVSFEITFQFQFPTSQSDLVLPGGALPTQVTIPANTQCGSLSIQTARDQDTSGETFAVSIATQIPWVTIGAAVVDIVDDGVCTLVALCPSDVTVTAPTGSTGSIVSWSNPSCSGCNGAVPSCEQTSGTFFQVGTHQVTCSCSGPTGNIARCMFTVTVESLVCTPIAQCPTDITATSLTGSGGNWVTWTSPGCGMCAGAEATCDRGSGTFFQVGSATVTCTCRDSSTGNAGSPCTFTVTVTPVVCTPVAQCPTDITATSLTGSGGNWVTWTSPGCGMCTGAEATCDIGSGSFFQVGTTTVTCTCRDSSTGNAGSPCTFTVTVTPVPVVCTPVAQCPTDLTVTSLAGNVGNRVTWTSLGCGICAGAEATCDRGSGDFFQVGSATVTCTCRDSSTGNAGPPCTFTVTVTPVCMPVAVCPSDITVESISGNIGNVVSGIVPNCGECEGTTATCNPPTTSLFPVGSTAVTCTCASSTGNTASCSFAVTVTPVCMPVAVCPSDITVESLSGNIGNVVSGIGPNCGECEGTTTTCNPPTTSLFQVGSTTVTCTCSSSNGNTASCSFVVNVTPVASQIVISDCPVGLTRHSLDGQSITVFWSEPTGDFGGSSITPTRSHFPGQSFPVGETNVIYTFSANGLTQTCSFFITVTSPGCTSTCPEDIELSYLPTIGGNIAQWSEQMCSQECSSNDAMCDRQSGDFFQEGETQVTCTCASSTGSVPCMFTVNVKPMGSPNATCPSPSTLTVTEYPDVGTVVIWDASVICTDSEDIQGSISPDCNRNPGVFHGPTVVTCTCTDSDDNEDTCSFTILNTAPVITCPADVTATSVRGNSGAVIRWGETGCTDAEEGDILPDCDQAAGSFLARVGVTMVSCACTDSSGASDSCQVRITVLPFVDLVSLACPEDITTLSTGVSSISWTVPTCSSNSPTGTVPALCDREPESVFEDIGATNVTCVCPGQSRETCTFTVTVMSGEGPDIPVWLYALAAVALIALLIIVVVVCYACKKKAPTMEEIDLGINDGNVPHDYEKSISRETMETKFNTYNSVHYNRNVYRDDGEVQEAQEHTGPNEHQYADLDELEQEEEA